MAVYQVTMKSTDRRPRQGQGTANFLPLLNGRHISERPLLNLHTFIEGY